jgi:hypothetical protein
LAFSTCTSTAGPGAFSCVPNTSAALSSSLAPPLGDQIGVNVELLRQFG